MGKRTGWDDIKAQRPLSNNRGIAKLVSDGHAVIRRAG